MLDPAALHAGAPVADLHAHPALNAFYLRRDLGREHKAPGRWNPLRQQVDLPPRAGGRLRVLTNCVYAPSSSRQPLRRRWAAFRGARATL